MAAIKLENLVVERDMPKGYVWAKVINCWTVDPSSSRYFPQNEETGQSSAYYTAILSAEGERMVERVVVFKGADADWAQAVLAGGNQSALVSAEGHIYIRESVDDEGNTCLYPSIRIKEGTLSYTTLEAHSPRIYPSVAPLSASAASGGSLVEFGSEGSLAPF